MNCCGNRFASRAKSNRIACYSSLTPIEGDVSLDVMWQCEENPFPRWTVNPVMRPGRRPDSRAGSALSELLIAGCGTGQHVFQIVELFPDARALAVDISRPNLAYARRKSRKQVSIMSSMHRPIS